MLEFHSYIAWKEHEKENRDKLIAKEAKEGKACLKCKTRFAEVVSSGTCPVCQAKMILPLDDETLEYLHEAGITPEEFF
jgi:Zn finger protein HypA/HybF involved in hydrogenase expression